MKVGDYVKIICSMSDLILIGIDEVDAEKMTKDVGRITEIPVDGDVMVFFPSIGERVGFYNVNYELFEDMLTVV